MCHFGHFAFTSATCSFSTFKMRPWFAYRRRLHRLLLLLLAFSIGVFSFLLLAAAIWIPARNARNAVDLMKNISFLSAAHLRKPKASSQLELIEKTTTVYTEIERADSLPFRPRLATMQFLRKLEQQRAKTSCAQTLFPDFLVIGAQKGGTSSFHAWFKRGLHPHVHVPLVGKELNLFTEKLSILEDIQANDVFWSERDVQMSDNSVESEKETLPYMPAGVYSLEQLLIWYQQQFHPSVLHTGSDVNNKNDAYGKQCFDRQSGIYGEASPNYSIHPYAPERAHALFPNTKIVFLLRNPVDRVKSAFNMKWQAKHCGASAWQTRDCFRQFNQSSNHLAQQWLTEFRATIEKERRIIEKCLRATLSWSDRALWRCRDVEQRNTAHLYMDLENHYHLSRSLYIDQIKHWERYYPTGQFLFLSSEDMLDQPQSTIRSFIEFMGLNATLLDWKPIDVKYHVREYPWIDSQKEWKLLENELKAFFRPFNERLFQWLELKGRSTLVKRLRRSWTP